MCKAKICGICKEERLTTEFHKDSSKPSGLYHWCKSCTKTYRSEYRKKNKEKIRLRAAKYITENKEKIYKYNREYQKEYNLRPEVKEKINKRRYERFRIDPEYRLRCNTSSTIAVAVKKNGGNKNGKTMDFLPYSIKELRTHLEDQFVDNMSWENYGSYWHIDHIYPHSKLPYDSLQHPNFQKAWALKNLRPLKASENSSKNDKIDEVLLREYGLESYIEGKI
tara:strand:+ start:60 stop:728 length:669 start_codon:yes stop_codon:yes gene_type:complete